MSEDYFCELAGGPLGPGLPRGQTGQPAGMCSQPAEIWEQWEEPRRACWAGDAGPGVGPHSTLNLRRAWLNLVLLSPLPAWMGCEVTSLRDVLGLFSHR